MKTIKEILMSADTLTFRFKNRIFKNATLLAFNPKEFISFQAWKNFIIVEKQFFNNNDFVIYNYTKNGKVVNVSFSKKTNKKEIPSKSNQNISIDKVLQQIIKTLVNEFNELDVQKRELESLYPSKYLETNTEYNFIVSELNDIKSLLDNHFEEKVESKKRRNRLWSSFIYCKINFKRVLSNKY